MAPFNYHDFIQQAKEFLQRGDKKKPIALFQESLNASAEVGRTEDQKLKLIVAHVMKPN